MMLLTHVTCFWLLVVCVSLSTPVERTVVLKDTGINTTQCLNGSTPCRSLNYAAQHINTSVQFLVDGKLFLEELVTFNFTSDITISGTNNSELVCIKSGGLSFLHTQSILLRNITIIGCGFLSNLTIIGFQYQFAVLMFNCSNIVFSNVVILNSVGYGAVLINNFGIVNISKTSFLNSRPGLTKKYSHGGSGMLILLSFCGVLDKTCNEIQQHPGYYLITNSSFSNNSINLTESKDKTPWGLFYGGGLGILMWWGAYQNAITITNSVFNNNSSPCGAGMSIQYNMNSSSNIVNILSSNFTGNSESSLSLGGAGVALGAASDDIQNFPSGNNVSFQDCLFKKNAGYYGAGSLIYSAAVPPKNKYSTNHFSFNNCHWEQNYGIVSPAVDIEPDFYSILQSSFLINISFINCKFSSNKLNKQLQKHHEYQAGSGIFLVTKLEVHFSGETLFKNNEGSSLVLYSSRAIFSEGSTVKFLSNTGGAAGALVLFELSSLRYWNNTQFHFENNQASSMGGAIYVFSYMEHQRFSSRSCFMSYAETSVIPRDINVKFFFKANIAHLGFANSIYVDTLKPCQYSCWGSKNELSPLQEVFSNDSCFGQFYFYDETNSTVGTGPVNFNLTSPPPYSAIPGRKSVIPLSVTDELGNDATAITVLQSNLEANNLSIGRVSSFVTDNNIVLTGVPGGNGSLVLYDPKSYIGVNVSVYMAECPPGYVSQGTTGESNTIKCVCAYGTQFKYKNVIGCDELNGVALLTPGAWIGYTEEKANENNLYTGVCYYCKPASSSEGIKLSPNASKKGLEELMCPENRKGILCNECKVNHSVFYHSSRSYCYPNKLCHFGVIFYLLGEIVPNAILFIGILFFDINLTSGYAYSLIFLAQMILKVRSFYEVGISNSQSWMLDIVIAIYSVANLEFFKFEKLSYCIWSNAGHLDIIVIKYVSVLFAIGLVVTTVLLVNRCNCQFVRSLRRKKQLNLLKGLVALLVICYFQCTRIAFESLASTALTGKGGKSYHSMFVTTGNMKYFSRQHLPYAIPAIIVILVVVIPFPVLLALDPFLLKMESVATRVLCSTQNWYPWTKLRNRFKPVLDAFYGCFKDEFRFMSGLFFLYRAVILLDAEFSPDLKSFYGALQFILIFMFAVQSLLQPFNDHKHNIVALLVFLDLTLINCCSVVIFVLLDSVDSDVIHIINWFQLSLMYLPILCVLCFCGWKGALLLCRRMKHIKQANYGYETLSFEHRV